MKPYASASSSTVSNIDVCRHWVVKKARFFDQLNNNELLNKINTFFNNTGYDIPGAMFP
jgi:hypothetical protein